MFSRFISWRSQAFREALPLAERLERDMSNLENWLEDKTSEVKRREEAGFPEDVDAEIKWNKVSRKTGRPMLWQMGYPP